MTAALALVLLALVPGTAATPVEPTLALDRQASHVAFAVSTPWQQRFTGHFERFQGELTTLDDGRLRLHLQVESASAVLPGHPALTRRMHGPGFFAVAEHPAISFLSEPFSPDVLHTGGPVAGQLTLRGHTHPEELTVLPTTCTHPGRNCAVAGSGHIDRHRYGMQALRMLLRNKVDFHVQARFSTAT